MYHKRSKGPVLVLENGTTKMGLVIDVLLFDSDNTVVMQLKSQQILC